MATNVERPTAGSGFVTLCLGGGLLVVVLILGLFTLSEPGDRGDVLTWITSTLTLVMTGTTTAVVVQARNISKNVGVVAAQTNGSLDKRIRDAVTDVLKAGQDSS